MQNLPQKDFLSISEAANLLNVSIDTLRRWDKSGIISSVRLDGKNRYFLRSQLLSLKEKQPLAISEAAQRLGVSIGTVNRLQQQGFLKEQRNSRGERVFTPSNIEQYLTAKKLKVVTPPQPIAPSPSSSAPKIQVSKRPHAPSSVRWYFIGLSCLLGLSLMSLFTYGITRSKSIQKIKTIPFSIQLPENTQQVLAEAVQQLKGRIIVNVPSLFNQMATFSAGITAPNIIYDVLPGTNIT